MTRDRRSIIREAAQALRFNRQRSILTTVSLAWGVACFVILNGYGDGFHRAMLKAFRSQGQDLVLVFGGRTSTQAGGERAGRRIQLERTDVEAIREAAPMIAAISPEMMMRGSTVVHGYRQHTHHRARRTYGVRARAQPDHGNRALDCAGG